MRFVRQKWDLDNGIKLYEVFDGFYEVFADGLVGLVGDEDESDVCEAWDEGFVEDFFEICLE